MDRILSNDEAYAVTTTIKNVGPVARSVFKIQRLGSDADDLVRYG